MEKDKKERANVDQKAKEAESYEMALTAYQAAAEVLKAEDQLLLIANCLGSYIYKHKIETAKEYAKAIFSILVHQLSHVKAEAIECTADFNPKQKIIFLAAEILGQSHTPAIGVMLKNCDDKDWAYPYLADHIGSYKNVCNEYGLDFEEILEQLADDEVGNG